MYCMKCGKETQEGQVFCPACLKVMEAYPVKPDAAIYLPNRSKQQAAKKNAHRRRSLPTEEQLLQQKKISRRLFFTCILLILLLGLTVGALVHQLSQPEITPITIGDPNYSFK